MAGTTGTLPPSCGLPISIEHPKCELQIGHHGPCRLAGEQQILAGLLTDALPVDPSSTDVAHALALAGLVLVRVRA